MRATLLALALALAPRGARALTACGASNTTSASTDMNVIPAGGLVQVDSQPQSLYLNNENCVMRLSAPSPGQCLRITFLTFDTESGYDFTTVFDADVGTTAPFTGPTIMPRTSGHVVPSAPFTTTGQYMSILFTSDSSVTYGGWQASVAVLTCPVAPSASPSPAPLAPGTGGCPAGYSSHPSGEHCYRQ